MNLAVRFKNLRLAADLYQECSIQETRSLPILGSQTDESGTDSLTLLLTKKI